MRINQNLNSVKCVPLVNVKHVSRLALRCVRPYHYSPPCHFRDGLDGINYYDFPITALWVITPTISKLLRCSNSTINHFVYQITIIIISSWLVTHHDGGCRKPTLELRYCAIYSAIKLKSIISKANKFSIVLSGWHMPALLAPGAKTTKIQFGGCRVAVAVSFCATNVSDGVNERRSLFSLRDTMRSHHITSHCHNAPWAPNVCNLCLQYS